jgi:hypothetical protein
VVTILSVDSFVTERAVNSRARNQRELAPKNPGEFAYLGMAKHQIPMTKNAISCLSLVLGPWSLVIGPWSLGFGHSSLSPIRIGHVAQVLGQPRLQIGEILPFAHFERHAFALPLGADRIEKIPNSDVDVFEHFR